MSESKLILKVKLSKELKREMVEVLVEVIVDVLADVEIEGVLTELSFESLVDIEVVSLGLKVVKVVS